MNAEQPVLDAISELVDWQLEEGQRRGDGPPWSMTITRGLDRGERSVAERALARIEGARLFLHQLLSAE